MLLLIACTTCPDIFVPGGHKHQTKTVCMWPSRPPFVHQQPCTLNVATSIGAVRESSDAGLHPAHLALFPPGKFLWGKSEVLSSLLLLPPLQLDNHPPPGSTACCRYLTIAQSPLDPLRLDTLTRKGGSLAFFSPPIARGAQPPKHPTSLPPLRLAVILTSTYLLLTPFSNRRIALLTSSPATDHS